MREAQLTHHTLHAATVGIGVSLLLRLSLQVSTLGLYRANFNDRGALETHQPANVWSLHD
jgi:hypothetical protein